ncbi:MAG: iron ABC transporter substrate-binding protein [Alphaproteobacteria bacterium]|nr:iron ABC transporter substrate-binding protein [Alphaproteobacteria bacterium]
MTPLRILVSAAVAVAVCLPHGPASARPAVETDDAGRHVAVPARPMRVFPAGAPAAILLYTLAPELMLGWTRALTPEERRFVKEPFGDLPELGRLTGRGNSANVEEVLKRRADLILDLGSTRATFAQLADQVQAQTGVPVLLLDGRMAALPTAYRRLGRILGVGARAEQLAAEFEARLGEIDRAVSALPPERRPLVYYGRGPDGLETGGTGSINAELIEVAGGRNVAGEGIGRGNLFRASVEQILAWRPEVVLALDPAFAAAARAEPTWRSVPAVRSGQVYQVPRLPFGWFDFPPSANRLLGAIWLSRLLHPDLFADDAAAASRAFFALFYQRPLTDAEAAELLAGAAPARRARR